jgi:hypothetical protein
MNLGRFFFFLFFFRLSEMAAVLMEVSVGVVVVVVLSTLADPATTSNSFEFSNLLCWWLVNNEN